MIALTWEQLSVYVFIEKKVKRNRNMEKFYFYRFNVIKEFFKDKEFTKDNVLIFFESLSQKNMSEAGKNTYVTVIKHIARCMNMTFLDTFTRFDVPDKYFDVLTQDEIYKIIHTETPRKYHMECNKRYSIVIETLAETGMRADELANLKWEDFKGDLLIVRRSKNNSMRMVPVTESLSSRINSLPRYNHGYIYGSAKGKIDQHHLNDEIRERCRILKIQKEITCHSFRRSFITECGANNENQMKVSRIVGHRNINSTNRYYYGSINALREVVENLPICAAQVGIDVAKRRAKRFIESFKHTQFKVLYKDEGKKIVIEIEDPNLATT